jgi:UDP-N-acetylglucosamine--N-acetylmuramyl-(pentapeptide) pyrophosphoryl-undecaprenol N-acetylglucosamine transferase
MIAATERDAAAPHGASCPLEVVSVRSPRTPRGVVGLPAYGARLSGAVARAVGLLREIRPHVVVGLGGYGSVAPALAARLLRIPVLVLEQNAVAGRANALLSRVGAVTATAFPDMGSHGLKGEVIHTGNPVRFGVLRPWPAHEKLVPGRS